MSNSLILVWSAADTAQLLDDMAEHPAEVGTVVGL